MPIRQSNSYDSQTRAWADVFMQKKNVPQRCSSIAFDFFDLSSSHHQISCRRVQSIFETTFIKSEACPTMPCISLVYIFLNWYFVPDYGQYPMLRPGSAIPSVHVTRQVTIREFI